jgi:hypothetical protein
VRDIRIVEERGKEDAILVRRPPRFGRYAPRPDERARSTVFATREIAEFRIRIIGVDR